MKYGFAVYNSKGVDVTGILTPTFFLDKFTASSGSKTYDSPPPGKTLKAVWSIFPFNNDNYIDLPVPSVVISGNTISWSNLYTGLGSYIYTYWG